MELWGNRREARRTESSVRQTSRLFFPLEKAALEDVAYGYKGKGILIHTLTDGNGMPLSCCTTAANGSEPEQVMPLLNSVTVKTNSPGRPRKRVKVLAGDKGYDSKELRATLRKALWGRLPPQDFT